MESIPAEIISEISGKYLDKKNIQSLLSTSKKFSNLKSDI